MNEKDLYRKARLKDAHWYAIALITIIAGFYLYPPFSIGSIIPSTVAFLWAAGIARRGRLETQFLLEAEPIVERLKADGMTEHDAMLRCGIDGFYYNPFWAVR